MPKPPAKAASLDTVFDDIKAILARHSKPFTVREGAVRNKRDYHLILEKPLVINGRPKKELWFASVIQQKHNVGFYFMLVNDCAKDGNPLSPELLSHLDGKGCFHMTSLTPGLKKAIDSALKFGLAAYKKRKWL